MMEDFKSIRNRREFLKDGLRTVLFGGLAFTGLFLGWRGYSRSGKESSCLVRLPCVQNFLTARRPEPLMQGRSHMIPDFSR